MTIAWLPAGTSVWEMAGKGLSPGVMSAGMGEVPAEQTLLDISQGNRVFDSLYAGELPAGPRGGICGPSYAPKVVERAESAPADIVPGLLAATLAAAGRRCTVEALAAGQLAGAIAALRGDDLLIAIARPAGSSDDPLPIGIAGRGFAGNLTSDSTRTDGYVLSTDVAPTVLDRLGIEVPPEMSGEPIRAEAPVDPGAVESRAKRMDVIPSRRGPVIGLSLLAWLLAAAAVAFGRRPLAGEAVRILGLSIVYLPLLLLAGAALEPGQTAEALLVALGSPALATLTRATLDGYRAIAVAAAATVGAYAIDVIAGSPLTALSLLGPNPGLGVRFYGIGNELEAVLAVLVVAGSGAALSGFAPGAAPRSAAAVFLAAAILAAAVFAAGRFGADVGAAIVLPFGGAVAAAAIAARSRRALLLVAALPVAAVAALAFADLVSGADAHLTRSVLDAGGLGELGEVAQRRLELSAHSFARPVVFVFMPLVVAAAALAWLGRRRIGAWLDGRQPVRAGLLGALSAVVIGALANDSGALLLEIGAAYLLVFLGYAWAEHDRGPAAGPARGGSSR